MGRFSTLQQQPFLKFHNQKHCRNSSHQLVGQNI
jgi:hypothetical protein